MCQLSTHLVYFWMPISLGIESGRMIMRHMTKSAKRWSVYQWYGISPSVFPVTVSYRDRHTETHRQLHSKRKYPFVSLSCVYIHISLLQSLTLKHMTHKEQQRAHSHKKLTTYTYLVDPAQPPKRPQRSWRGWKQSRSHIDDQSSVHTPLVPHHDTCSADWLMRHSQEWPTHLWEKPGIPERKMSNCHHNIQILFQLYPH